MTDDRYKSQTTGSKNYMTSIIKSKKVPYLHCGPCENERKRWNMGLAKTIKISEAVHFK